eukprot:600111-Pelagomonas_calceolata.AAC.1
MDCVCRQMRLQEQGIFPHTTCCSIAGASFHTHEQLPSLDKGKEKQPQSPLPGITSLPCSRHTTLELLLHSSPFPLAARVGARQFVDISAATLFSASPSPVAELPPPSAPSARAVASTHRPPCSNAAQWNLLIARIEMLAATSYQQQLPFFSAARPGAKQQESRRLDRMPSMRPGQNNKAGQAGEQKADPDAGSATWTEEKGKTLNKKGRVHQGKAP